MYEKLTDSEKKEMLGALKRNVYYTQNKKGGNCSCDQLFAEILKKDLNIIVYKDKPNHPKILFKNYLTQQLTS